MAVKHRYRTSWGFETKKITPMKAIRLRCLDCCYWQPSEVKRCGAENCALWPFRSGRKPKEEE